MERKVIRKMSEIPSGFIYRPEFISGAEETELLERIQALQFEQANYRGYLAKRRIVQFGFGYSFKSRQASEGEPIPEWLLPLRNKVSEVLEGALAEQFVEAIVTEYSPGAQMGWHRDAPQFGTVFGVSLAAPCRMRLRLTTKEAYEITSVELMPRSAYVMVGTARWRWQHSIPAVEQLRYSITFRTLKDPA